MWGKSDKMMPLFAMHAGLVGAAILKILRASASDINMRQCFARRKATASDSNSPTVHRREC
jgi:hypothetical protein